MVERQKAVYVSAEKAAKYLMAAQDIESATFENAPELDPDMIEELLSISRRLSEIASKLTENKEGQDTRRLN